MLLIFVYASIFKTTSFQVHLLELSRFGMLWLTPLTPSNPTPSSGHCKWFLTHTGFIC
jgi:hypothetical protein